MIMWMQQKFMRSINSSRCLFTTSAAVRRETANDSTLSRVLFLTRSGWAHSSDRDQDLRPYFQRRNEISNRQDCLMWGGRVIVPAKLRQQISNQLHEWHSGVVKMKSLARSYFWYPGLDGEIETLTKKCTGSGKIWSPRGLSDPSCDTAITIPFQVFKLHFAMIA